MSFWKVKYFHDFPHREAIINAFQCDEMTFPIEDQILIASYTYVDYSGSAFVLFQADGKLWEVDGSHCSCNGLEGQWKPYETSWKALAMREFYSFDEAFRDRMKALIQEHTN